MVNMTEIPVTRYYFLLLFGLVGLTFCRPSVDENTSANTPVDTYTTDEMTLQHGMELFNQHCASCHNFSENGIGPNLSGVTSAVDKQWLVSFIQNPSEVIESGDARAVGLFEKYNQYMPAFSMLAAQDLEHILGFVHKFSEGERRNKSNRSGGILDPIPTKIASSGLALVIEQQLTVPASSEVPPITRINKMNAIPGGRVFIHDL
jgi:mono/diheme cytochrome c family protein